MSLDCSIEVRGVSNWAAAHAHVGAERERTSGHGHGMSKNRTPKGDSGLPHDDKRDDKQPYAAEVEDYSGDGATTPPGGQTGRDEKSNPGTR